MARPATASCERKGQSAGRLAWQAPHKKVVQTRKSSRPNRNPAPRGTEPATIVRIGPAALSGPPLAMRQSAEGDRCLLAIFKWKEGMKAMPTTRTNREKALGVQSEHR